MKIFLLLLLSFAGVTALGQSSVVPLTYSRILQIDSATKTGLYDKALIWCSKAFNDSKSAINVREKESGIIAGKALLSSYYKIPKKKDSALSWVYSNYLFDWLIEAKDGKLRFSVKNISLHEDSGDYPVFEIDKAPIKIAFTSEERIRTEWECSKAGLLNNIDKLVTELYTDLLKNDSW